MIYALDIFGTFVFAVSGAFRAVRYELDLLGFLTLSLATGVGGGILRDLMLGKTPPAAFRVEAYLLTCLAGGGIVFFSAQKIALRWDWVMAADALGLSVFAALGAASAAEHGLGKIGVVLMAAITASGGGVVRDILVTEIPMVLRADFYATAALAGGVSFLIARGYGFSENIQLFCGAMSTFVLRVAAMRYKIALPRAQRLPLSPSQLTRLRKENQDTAPEADKEKQ